MSLTITHLSAAALVKPAVDVLARSLYDSPHFVDIFPADAVRAVGVARVCELGLRDALPHRHVYVATDNGTVAGAAVWLPPGRFPPTFGRQLAAISSFMPLLRWPQALRRLLQFAQTAQHFHPPQPYWYLVVLGVDPSAQGKGIGSRLLEPVLTRADEDDVICYLETHAPRTVAFYARHGFTVERDQVPFTPGGPAQWTMKRTPHPSFIRF
jgi:ribosomal protein S18 acetylase RimI-like enzyme